MYQTDKLEVKMIHYEVRKCIIAAHERGLSVDEIVYAYGYKKTAIYNLIRQSSQEGSVEPKTHQRGRKPALDSIVLEAMKNKIIEKPDITINKLRETLSIPLSESQTGRIIRNKLKFSLKKRQYTQASETSRK